MIHVGGRTVGAAALCLVLLPAVAGCSSGAPQRVVTVTVPPSRASTSASSGAPGSAGARPSGSATPSPTSTVQARLGGACDSLLPDYPVTQALGVPTLAGVDAFVVGIPDPVIGRIGYVNCRYGVTGTGAAARPKVEIGVSLYGTAQQAAKRVQATVDDYTAHGARVTPTTVAGRPGTLLTGGAGAGYTLPTLVVASEQRSVAVSIDPAVATGAAASAGAVKLATLAIERTGG